MVSTTEKTTNKTLEPINDSSTEQVLPIPNLLVPQYLFTLTPTSQSSKHEETKTQLINLIEDDGRSF